MPKKDDRFLFISDLQIPFEAKGALRFCKAVQREFRVPAENIYNVGDETDQYHGSRHPKDPDADLTPIQELSLTRERLRPWYDAFPKMGLAISNHGLRWVRKASEAQIPSEVLRAYQELIGAPRGWSWKEEWIIKGNRANIKMIHGMGYGGMYAYRHAAIDQGMNIVFGHLHSHAGIAKVETASRSNWGMNVGCLIDKAAFAFKYGREHRFKPCLGVGVVIDGGLTPLLIPYERFT